MSALQCRPSTLRSGPVLTNPRRSTVERNSNHQWSPKPFISQPFSRSKMPKIPNWIMSPLLCIMTRH
uniref:Uncharacterized protein n=1 Tax=Picea sitchensis TaxID=3332 RepID=A0A6B9XTP4_PICSI|nr:hypothetical protein Q903MT_gene3753 [Picea sitchensis]